MSVMAGASLMFIVMIYSGEEYEIPLFFKIIKSFIAWNGC